MPFLAQLHTSTTVWPAPDAVAVAINAQIGLDAEVQRQHDDLRIFCRQPQRTSLAALRPFDQVAYDVQRVQMRLQISDRECEAAPRFARTVAISTTGDDAAAALCHVAIADALWWLLGGFLADLTTNTLWGRSAWRQERTLREHAAVLARGSEVGPAPLPLINAPARSTVAPGSPSITVYTLPYCRHCRALTAHLIERGLTYQEIDVVQTPGAAATMLSLNNGQRAAPTIAIGKQVLVGPEPEELDEALRAAGLLSGPAAAPTTPLLPGWMAPCTLPGC